VLLPGDPGRALALAQVLMDAPRMFNHHRGLWGYTGTAADGEPLTIQATGMGGPSAAIVLEELCDLGVQRAVRVGTCGALDARFGLGDLIAVGSALAADGTSSALGADERVSADPEITAALEQATGRPAELVVSTDVFYERDASRARRWHAAGAVAVEMEAATLLQVGALRGIAVGCVLTVSDVLAGDARERIDAEALVAAAEALGAAGAAGLGIPARDSSPAEGLVDPELEREKAERAARRTADGTE
jgi:uridine phosphorylase